MQIIKLSGFKFSNFGGFYKKSFWFFLFPGTEKINKKLPSKKKEKSY